MALLLGRRIRAFDSPYPDQISHENETRRNVEDERDAGETV